MAYKQPVPFRPELERQVVLFPLGMHVESGHRVLLLSARAVELLPTIPLVVQVRPLRAEALLTLGALVLLFRMQNVIVLKKLRAQKIKIKAY